jgi:HEAT repeat protein
MKKRIARMVVYFALAVATTVVILHPYVWQSVFGPTIKGEPLWAWQQEYRSRMHRNVTTATAWEKLLSLLKLDSRPISWIGVFPHHDPEMLPVLLSLADAGDVEIRARVAHNLESMPAEDATINALIRMLDDQAQAVQLSALQALRSHGPAAAAARAKLQALLNSGNADVRTNAATALLAMAPTEAAAQAIVRESLNSKTVSVRRSAMLGLDAWIRDDKDVLALVLDASENDPDPICQSASFHALRHFGKPVVPLVIERLEAGNVRMYHALRILGHIGPDAKEAIPALQKLLDAHSDRAATKERINNALKRIDPARFDKK